MRQIFIILFAIAIFFFSNVVVVNAETRLKTVEFFINNTATQIAANAFFNSTLSILLPETGVNVKSAHIEVYGVSPSGTAGNIEVRLNDTILGIVAIPGGGEWFGFRFLVNGTNLYSLSGGVSSSFVLSLRPNTAMNAFSSKVVITYQYDDTSATQIQTVQYFINLSAAAIAATGSHKNLFRIQLPDTNPSVKSAWFEIGGLTSGAAALSLTALLNGTSPPYGSSIALSTATLETESFIVNINAKSSTASIYSINNNNPFIYNLTVTCGNAPCRALHEKLYITYTFTTRNQTTLEFFVNSTGPQSGAGVWQNYTFPVQLFGTNPSVRNAYFEIYGGLTGTANSMDVFLNDNILNSPAIALDFGRVEASGFKVAVNGTGLSNDLYGITDNTIRVFKLSIRCNSAACNAISAKAVITYSFTSPINQTNVVFFVNSSTTQIAAGGWMNSTAIVQLPEPFVSVSSVFIESGGNWGGTAAMTSRVVLGNEVVPNDASTWSGTGTNQPYYGFRTVYNATNSTSSSTPYGITDNTPKAFKFGIQCSGSACNNLNQKLILLYSFTPPVTGLSFNITLPGLSPNKSSDIQPGTLTTPINFSATAKTENNVIPCVYNSNYCQDGANSIFTFKNTGNAGEKWNMSLSQALPSYIHLYGNTINSRVGETEITPNGWIVANNILPGNYVQAWLWADYLDVPSGPRIEIAINHTSMTAT
jgi:hypothetical protein